MRKLKRILVISFFITLLTACSENNGEMVLPHLSSELLNQAEAKNITEIDSSSFWYHYFDVTLDNGKQYEFTDKYTRYPHFRLTKKAEGWKLEFQLNSDSRETPEGVAKTINKAIESVMFDLNHQIEHDNNWSKPAGEVGGESGPLKSDIADTQINELHQVLADLDFLIDNNTKFEDILNGVDNQSALKKEDDYRIHLIKKIRHRIMKYMDRNGMETWPRPVPQKDKLIR